jgi:hypothetical protein
MAWGDPYVSQRLTLSNGVSAWGTGGLPVSVALQQTGILESLRAFVSGTVTIDAGTGSIAAGVSGPWNTLSLITLSPNQQAPIVQLSGLGLNLFQQMKSVEHQVGSPDVSAIAIQNGGTATDTYTFPATGTAVAYRYYQDIPVAQRIRSLGGFIGYWPLQNPAVQLQVQYTPNSGSAATPYNIFSTTAGAAPYLVTGNATAVLASPTVEFVRNMWEVPINAEDLPPFELVSTVVQESPQGSAVGGATRITWQATPLSGLLVRLGIYIFNGTTGTGVASALLNTNNALTLTYDADTPKFSESAFTALARMREFYGYNLQQGFFSWDFLGRDLTLQDVIDTNTTANIKLTVNLSTALGATNSNAFIVRQIISPLEVR